MKWEKLGLVFNIKVNKPSWLKSHAMTPTPILLRDRIRVYFSARSFQGESKISYFDVNMDNPKEVIYVHDKPLFDIGSIGMFDDSGTICTCAVNNNGIIYLYYTAYSLSVKVPYRNSIGVAISEDGGNTFRRMFDGPILDRSKFDPYFVISPWVTKQDDIWHLWYSSATEWIVVNGKPESVYHIKYAYSKDGINWITDNQSCIQPLHKEEANARPTVILEDNKWKMWFTYRGSRDFRDGLDSYRIGYAEADMNKPYEWVRMDQNAGILRGPGEYDNLMQAYPSVLQINGKKVMFYNGNNFGSDGVCCAVM